MKNSRILLVFALLMILAYARENFILILNGALKSGNAYKANAEIPEFLFQMSPQLLNLSKVGLNFIFISVMLSITYFATKKHFHLKSELFYVKWTLIMLPLGFMGLFYVSNSVGLMEVRSISLDAIWIFQTPIPFMLFFAYFYYQDLKKK